jgi:hypothetical protein
MPTTIDNLSLCTIPLEQYFKDTRNETRLGQGTGFIWRAGKTNYLVTNWHVLSGRDFFTGKNLDEEHGGRPTVLRGLFDLKTGLFDRHRLEFRINDEEDRPLWLVHRNRKVDIAVLPVAVVRAPINDASAFSLLYPINEPANAKLRTAIGMEVFILGYPFEIELPGYPIWKRGSIASESELASLMSALGSAVRHSDYMLVDTASRPGMSGAPVIRRSWSNHDVEPGYIATVDIPIDRFIGVYPGRAHTDGPHEAQIGLVWNVSLIEEIIAGTDKTQTRVTPARLGSLASEDERRCPSRLANPIRA